MEKQLSPLEGVVESVIYRNDENGYIVAQIKTQAQDEVTVVGIVPFLSAGERLSAVGQYVNHAQYGLQFSIESCERTPPESEEDIYQYLASHAIRGVGAKTARSMVDRFGAETLHVIASEPERLSQIRGITPARAREIGENFIRLSAMKLLFAFLSENSLPAHFAAALMQTYGKEALAALQRNPYLLCEEPFLLPFGEADALAQRSGFDLGSALRMESALVYELKFNLLQGGHAFIPEDKLVTATMQLCGASEDELYIRLEALYERGRIVCQAFGDRRACYLSEIYSCEDSVARHVARLVRMRVTPPRNLDKLIASFEARHNLEYAEKQREAMALCFRSGISLVTGGPGTGKTTALMTMIELITADGLLPVLAAPTGRAAQRMSELSGKEAKTIHRLLECCPDQRSGAPVFQRNGQNPLDADVIIIDEASMIDLSLVSALFDAAQDHARFVFVGDADQLPPIGSGNFFADLLLCDEVPKVRLTEVFRQARQSDIVVNAHKINRSSIPDLAKNSGDFYFAAARSGESVARSICALICERIPERFGIGQDKIQVICPSRLMQSGTASLNKVLQAALNPKIAGKQELFFGDTVFREGDRVIQTKNNYDLLWKRADGSDRGSGIFNGDTGVIAAIEPFERTLTVSFDGKDADYAFEDIAQLELAYAITAHKSQGSEYDAVIISAFAAPERLLNRSLFYTAVTRAKKLLVIVGRQETVAKMVQTERKNKRYGALKRRIRSYL